MAYSDNEISNQAGKPVALYEFKYGNTFWRYTTNDEDLTFGTGPSAKTFTAKAITDEGVTQGGSDQNDLQISMASDLPVTSLFRVSRPSGKLWLWVRRYHLGDPDTETPLLWLGTIVSSSYVDDATDRLNGRSIAGTYDRSGLRLSWGRMCPHPLYGIGCYVDKSLHAYPRTIDTKTGTSFTCTAHSEPEEGTFSGGFLEWERGDGSMETLGIEHQDGNDFRVFGSTAGLEIGTEVTIYPGCARNTTVCKLFDNLPNYGGFPHMPGKSPFDGSPVF